MDSSKEGSNAVKQVAPDGSKAAPMTVAALRERTVLAQRRYRERVKVRRQQAEQQVAKLEDEIQRMRLQQEELQERQAMLERQLEAAQATAPDDARQDAFGGGGDPGGGLGIPTSAQMPAATLQPSAQPQSLTQRSAWLLDEPTTEYIEKVLLLTGRMTFTVHPTGPILMTCDQAAAMPYAEFAELYSAYISALAQWLLVFDERDADSIAGRRLRRLTVELQQLKGSILAASPDQFQALQRRSYTQLQSGNGGTGSGGATDAAQPARDVWPWVVSMAGVTQQQCDTVASLRAVYLANMRTLERRRQALTATLQQLTTLPVDDSLPSSESSAAITETLDALQETLRGEHSSLLQLYICVWRRTLTPAQVARINVACYPLNADVIAVPRVMASLAAGGGGEAAGLAAAPSSVGAAVVRGELVPVDAALPPDTPEWRAPTVDLAALYPELYSQQETRAAAVVDARAPPSSTNVKVTEAAERTAAAA